MHVAFDADDTYADLLARHGVPIERFVVDGNSIRSDVAPISELPMIIRSWS